MTSKVILKFNDNLTSQENLNTSWIVIAVICPMIFFGIVAVIFIKKRKNSNIKRSALNPIYEKNVSFLHKTFLPEFVKDWSDIEIVNSIGEGNFGKVYKGFLSLDPIARYSSNYGTHAIITRS